MAKKKMPAPEVVKTKIPWKEIKDDRYSMTKPGEVEMEEDEEGESADDEAAEND